MELPHEELEMTERLFAEQVRPQLSPEGMERLSAMQGIADLDAVELEILNGLAPGEAMAAMQQMVAEATETSLAANREPNPAFREGPPPRLTTAAALVPKPKPRPAIVRQSRPVQQPRPTIFFKACWCSIRNTVWEKSWPPAEPARSER